MKIISTYAGHESSITFYVDGKITVVELDKLVGQKYFNMDSMSIVESSELLDLAMKVANVENDFDIWINGSYSGRRNGTLAHDKFDGIINYKRSIWGPGHHLCHAHCAYWQSGMDNAFLISSDGGGNDGYFNMYYCTKKTGPQPNEQIDRFDFGTIYSLIASTIPQIGKKTTWIYDVPGKAMSLASTLELPTDEKLLGIVRKLYSEFTNRRHTMEFSKHTGMMDEDQKAIEWWQANLSMSKGKTKPNTFKNERLGYRVAAANQSVFQEKYFNVINDRQYNIGKLDDNIILTGGCALNIINNQAIQDSGFNVYVPPNPTDGGLSLGGLFWYLHLIGVEIPQQDYKFSGIPLIENKKFRKKRKTPIKTIAKMLQEGKILGIVEGNAELGPRALGHRSIICDPSIRGIKDDINKIKHREEYRPFAPVILEDMFDEYFERSNKNNLESMSYAIKAKIKFERSFSAACHVDGTARVQICDDKDSTVYKLLTEIGTPLLNTSFNDNGYPIVSSIEDAYMMLPSLDGIVINGVLITE